MQRIAALLTLSLFPITVHAQCAESLVGSTPAFEISVPAGFQIDSAFLTLSNQYSNISPHVPNASYSTKHFTRLSGIENDRYNILTHEVPGPDTANYQILSGLNACYSPGDWLEFDWMIVIHCSGTSGVNIDYSGPYSDELSDPTHIGNVYQGENIISGSIDNLLSAGVWGYYDHDRDGFGRDEGQMTCFFSCFWSNYSTNNLDCDDLNAAIFPGAIDIPNNGIDENCDGSDLTTSTYAIANVEIKIYPNPVSSIVNIQVDNNLNYQASILDITGKVLYSSERPTSIDIAHLPEGAYILQIEDRDSGGSIVEKLVKG